MASVIIGEYFIDYSLSGEIREFTKNGNPVGTDEQKRIGRIIAEQAVCDLTIKLQRFRGGVE